MIFFAAFRPGSVPASHGPAVRAFPPANATPPDANPGTFYSAVSNLDLEIQDGNPGAVGVRARYAQPCFLAHMDFRIGSGLAGIHDGGNAAQDVHFYGGQYGIWTRKPSPGWQFTITLLKAEAAVPRPGMTPVLPVNFWRNENDFTEVALY